MQQDAFLARLRPSGTIPVPDDSRQLPPRPDLSRQELADRFSQELAAVGGMVYRASSLEDMRAVITKTLRARQVRHLVRTGAPIFEEARIDQALMEAGMESFLYDFKAGSREALRERGFSAHAGMTAVDYGVAETGTLALLARPGEGRAASLVPPIHLGVLRVQDIVFELGELFERVGASNTALPSALTFVTGPSSTADIELVHTVGVHGPRELHVVLVD